MKLKFLSLFLLVTVICFFEIATAQEIPLKNTTWKDSATFYIRALKDGALVVRLKTKSKAISAMRNEGREAEAVRAIQAQREENLSIKKAFDSVFNFCKVYYFFTDSTDALLSGKRGGYFLNSNLEVDDQIKLAEDFFMVAEKGKPVIVVKYDPSNSNKIMGESTNLNETIIILDDHLRQMKDPFPFYAQETFPQNILTTDWNSKVKNLNKKLIAYYRKMK